MTYGHNHRAPAADAVARALARAQGTWGGYRAWGELNADKRFELIEQALGCPANDLHDCFPAAL